LPEDQARVTPLGEQDRIDKRVRVRRWVSEDRILLVTGVAVAELTAEFAEREFRA
jgi:hypothetical protein